MTPTVYCYATDSYTETTIKDFLRKINPNVSWHIKCPRQAKRSKADYENKEYIPMLTGRTGVDEDKNKASYSKSKHGSEFLSEIEPAELVSGCGTYFAKAYHAIQKIG